MNEPVPGRKWQLRPIGGEWQDIAALSDRVVITAEGLGWSWRGEESWLPDQRYGLRYTIPVRGVWMAWRAGDWALLAQDMGRPELMPRIRDALVEARRQRTAKRRQEAGNASQAG